MITVTPVGGLGNRLRVLHSVLSLTEETSTRPLRVIWKCNKSLNCSYSLLFGSSNEIIVKEINSSIPSKIFENVCHLIGHDINNLSDYDIVLKNRDIYSNLKKKTDFKEMLANKRAYIETSQSFYGSYDTFRSPEPSQLVYKRVHEIVSSFQGNMIGVHIRRTDNKESIRESPTSLFIERMNAQLKNEPDTRFFLSTDSENVLTLLLSRFGTKKILFQKDKVLERNSKKGIIDAFVDMLCLSRTNTILGSYFSSFSNIASAIGGNEIEIIRR